MGKVGVLGSYLGGVLVFGDPGVGRDAQVLWAFVRGRPRSGCGGRKWEAEERLGIRARRRFESAGGDGGGGGQCVSLWEAKQCRRRRRNCGVLVSESDRWRKTGEGR